MGKHGRGSTLADLLRDARRLLVAVSLAVAAGAVTTGGPNAGADPARPFASPPAPGTAAEVAKLVADSHMIKTLPSNLVPSLADASSDTPEVIYPWTLYGCSSVTQCVFGDTGSSETIVLFGDSHAAMWLPALIPVATKDRYRIVLLFTLGCPAADVTIWAAETNSDDTACNTARSNDITLINKVKPALILLASRTSRAKSARTKFFTNAQWEAGLVKTITLLKPSGAKVAVIGDISGFNADPSTCLASSPSDVQHCSVSNPNPIKNNRGHQAAEKAAASKMKATYINTLPWLCTGTCSPVIGNMLAYSDSWHMSATYSTYLSTVFGVALKNLLK